MPGTPAARAGLREDDIITSVNGAPIYDSDSLVLEVGRLPVEAVAHLGVIRNGTRQTIDVVLSKYPVRGRKVVTVRPEAWRGVRVDYASAFLEPDQPQHFGLPMTDDAVVVCDVDQNTPAAQAGMKRGMLISHVDGRPVRTPKEFQAAIAEKTGAVQLRLVAERSVELGADRSARQLAVLAGKITTFARPLCHAQPLLLMLEVFASFQKPALTGKRKSHIFRVT